MITSFDQLDPNQRYTYADYLSWRFRELTNDEEYRAGRPLVPPDVLTSEAIPGFSLDLTEVFRE